MVLGTTTWRRRNSPRLKRARDAADILGFNSPVIIEYGPGGAVDFLIDYLPEGGKSDWSCWDKLQRGVVKLTESAVRKTNLFRLETSEPEEIARLFESMSPEGIYVVDKEKKVIDAVKRSYEVANLDTPFHYRVLNIQENQLDKQGDVVIAYNIIERVSDPIKSLESISNSTKLGGLLSTTIMSPPIGFEEIESGLYRKVF